MSTQFGLHLCDLRKIRKLMILGDCTNFISERNAVTAFTSTITASMRQVSLYYALSVPYNILRKLVPISCHSLTASLSSYIHLIPPILKENLRSKEQNLLSPIATPAGTYVHLIRNRVDKAVKYYRYN